MTALNSLSDAEEHEFGFLTTPLRAVISNAEITPVVDHDQRLSWFTDASNDDGYFYTPVTETWELDPTTMRRTNKVARSERPAQSFHLPSSHIIVIRQPTQSGATIQGDVYLLVQALALAFGLRLQLSRYRFDGRVPAKRQDLVAINDETAVHFVTHLYEWWKLLSVSNRLRVVNILYTYTRTLSFEWEWDLFPWQYMIFDAMWKLHCDLNGVPKSATGKSKGINHEGRMQFLCERYKIVHDTTTIGEIIKRRNDLFHEAKWMDNPVGFSAAGDGRGLQLPRHLARLNCKLICALSGYENAFAKRGWDFMGWQHFDRMIDD